MSLSARLDAMLPTPAAPEPSRSTFQRILLLDVETYPALVWQWSRFEKFTPVARIAREDGLLTWAAKWYGEPETMTAAYWVDGPDGLASRLWELVHDADVIVTYNGERFDLPWIRRAFLEQGLGPASPFASVDLFRTVRQFRLLAKSLDYVVRRLDLGEKVQHEGFEPWTKAMPPELGGAGDTDAQARMLDYNRGDVADTLEPLYDALLPWIKGHPHVGLFDDSGVNRCQRCGSTELVRSGTARTPLGAFRRFWCMRCLSWHRGRTRLAGVDARAI